LSPDVLEGNSKFFSQLITGCYVWNKYFVLIFRHFWLLFPYIFSFVLELLIFEFQIMYLDAWCWSVPPKYVACIDKTNIEWGMLQRTILQRTVFINKIRMPQRTQMLQRTRRNTIGRRSTRVRMTFSITFFTKERFFMLFKFTCTVHKG
jgi:hypothetical protein